MDIKEISHQYSTFIPDLCILAEVLLENADGPGTADVMRHQDVGIDPDVVARLDALLSGVTSKNFLGHGHRGHIGKLPFAAVPS